MLCCKSVTVISLISALAVGGAAADGPSGSTKEARPGTGPGAPLYRNLGDLSYPITTNNRLAQRYFDQGLRFTFAFNHEEARRAYREAQRHDPGCAMCYWGEALVVGPNINAPMNGAAGNPAVVAIGQAKARAHQSNEREQALIHALAKRYSDDPNVDRAALDRAYASAMAGVVERFPGDDMVAVFYADALMNVSPWDYWEADRKTPKGRIGNAVRVVEQVLARSPSHPGAIHLYIHLTEASSTPERAEPYAERLAALMPGAGHIVHMPAHTFFRIGRYRDSLETNQAAVAADEAYLAGGTAKEIYSEGYYPHNIHFAVVSAQMAGDGNTALDYAKRLDGKISEDVAERIGWIQAIIPAPYFVHAQFSAPETILSLPDPGNKFPYVKAMWHYTRGVALAATGDVDRARNEATAIADLNHKTEAHYPSDLASVAPHVLGIAQHVVEGRIARTQGDTKRAIIEFRAAVGMQDTLPYMEPPFWYYPVRQSLGAALLEAGKAVEAENVFAQSLENHPNNGWALYGLMRAQQAQGKGDQVRKTEKRFKQAWIGDPSTIELKRL